MFLAKYLVKVNKEDTRTTPMVGYLPTVIDSKFVGCNIKNYMTFRDIMTSITYFLIASSTKDCHKIRMNYRHVENHVTHPVITCSKLTIEALEQGVKYV